MKIAIDDGHGMETAGKRTPAFSNGKVMKENEFNRAVVKYLHDELLRNGFSVVLTAPEDTDVSHSARVQRANEAHADLFVSVHANAFGSGWNAANGVESFVYDLSDQKTVRFATCINDALVRKTGLRNRGVKENGELYVLRKTSMPAVLCECGFMTNAEEAALLLQESYRKTCAAAICQGICQFVGKTYQAEEAYHLEKIEVIYEGKTVEMMGVKVKDENGNILNCPTIRDFAACTGLKVSYKGATPILERV